MQIGSRDEALRPAHTYAVGAMVHDDRQTVTVFVPTARSERVLRDLRENGRIALGVALASHEAYQLKGTYVSSRPTDDAERARQEAYRAALFASALEAGYPEAIARPLTQGFAYTPAVRRSPFARRRSSCRLPVRAPGPSCPERSCAPWAILPDEIKPAMQGVIPCHVVTCSRDGTPNASAISQVYYVDPDHVALSHQFFNKTKRNIEENPRAAVWVISPETFETWDLELEFVRSDTSGPIFDVMEMQIEAIASMVGMKGHLQAAGRRHLPGDRRQESRRGADSAGGDPRASLTPHYDSGCRPSRSVRAP